MTKYPQYPDSNATPITVPKVRLYVERPEQQEAWHVNVGHVTERGRWRTKPHAHPAYGQVIFVRHGRGVMNREGCVVPFEGPCALLVPAECVHGLDYEMDADRWVVTIEVTYLKQINAKLNEFIQLWTMPRMIPLSYDSEATTEFYDLIKKLSQEVGTRAIGHVVGTEALLTSLLLILVRGTSLDQPDGEGAKRNATRLVDRFRELIEKHYRENLRLQNYASMMAVSPTQLRAACIAAAGQSPTKMIHARLIIEAKRNLIFGDMSIEQIAYWLGFSDSQFRSEARQESQHGR